MLTIGNNNTEAILETTEFEGSCKLLLKLKDSTTIHISTLESDPASCGFGAGVTADGTYVIKLLDNGQLEPINADDLIGRWRSTVDSTYEISIADGKFVEYNRGQKMNALLYEFFNKCPEDCFSGQVNNSLKAWNDQDTFCYIVVKLSLHELELSLLGGTGQSLLYERL